MLITQERVEKVLHKDHLLNTIADELRQYLPEDIQAGVAIIDEYLSLDTWESANTRRESLKDTPTEEVVIRIFSTIIMYCAKDMSLVSIASMIKLTDLDKINNVQLSADLIALLAPVGIYTLIQNGVGTYVVKSAVEPSEETQKLLKIKCYLPPMLVKPSKLNKNNDSGYKTIKSDRVILGSPLNFHKESVSLDVLNTLNSVEYEVDPHVSAQVKPWHREELSQSELLELSSEDREIYENDKHTYELYLEQIKYLNQIYLGKTIYFTHKSDSRGRLYPCAYHYNYAGNSYDKALINLKKKELVTGEL